MAHNLAGAGARPKKFMTSDVPTRQRTVHALILVILYSCSWLPRAERCSAQHVAYMRWYLASYLPTPEPFRGGWQRVGTLDVCIRLAHNKVHRCKCLQLFHQPDSDLAWGMTEGDPVLKTGSVWVSWSTGTPALVTNPAQIDQTVPTANKYIDDYPQAPKYNFEPQTPDPASVASAVRSTPKTYSKNICKSWQRRPLAMSMRFAERTTPTTNRFQLHVISYLELVDCRHNQLNTSTGNLRPCSVASLCCSSASKSNM